MAARKIFRAAKRALPFFLLTFLLVIAAAAYYIHRSDSERFSELESELRDLREREKQSEIVRGVSQQMEEIAHGQRILSEERSQEAIRQSERAQAATLRSEAERQKALLAQAAAETSAGEALASYRMAEQQRLAAERAKLMADTLNYISLGRTLGSLSYSIYQAGDTELGNMLAYASYLYTNDYGGDLYTSSVFRALTQSADGRRNWNVHNGSISKIEFFPKSERLLTVGFYGEIYSHEMKAGILASQCLFNDKNYYFRDAFASNHGMCYAISQTGHLIMTGHGKTQIFYLEGVNRPFSIQEMNDGRQLLIVGERSISLFDLTTNKVIRTRQPGFNIISTGRSDGKPLLFDDQNRMHLVNGIDDLKTRQQPVTGRVTAFASNHHEQLTAYGMSDGTIWLINGKGKTYKLLGHLSQVTKMRFNGKFLYSSSYDGKLLFWMTSADQIKPITLFQSNSWLMDFTFDLQKDNIWTGNNLGSITEYLISLPKIAQSLRKKVKRNFTQEEWNYYVGKGIPYRKVNSE